MGNRLVLWVILIFLLAGCSFLPTYIVNEINMAQGVGYDLSKKNEIKGTFVFSTFKKDKSYTEAKTNFGLSSKEIRTKISNETRFPIVSGQMRIQLFGKSLAKKGINDLVDTFNRDPSIGSLVQLGIVDGDPHEMLQMKNFKNENISIYIQEMLNQNMKFGNIPQTDLQTFLFQYFQKGQDPYLPLIKKDDDNIKIIGMAFLKDDRYIFPLFWKDLFIFKCLVDKYRHGIHQFILKNGDRVLLDNLASKAKYKVITRNGKPEFTINLKLKTRLQEFSSPRKEWVKINKKEIQKEIERQLEINAIKIIHQFQHYGVDPIGFGAKYKEHNRGFHEKKWNSLYPSIKVQVNVMVDIKQTGTVD
ncbi:Ger(x)C family spore germination protein [Bacillus salipaludis]|uniref:Ger(x)C family spore germination protein n=1 Tax=Bacillus salipaludis TaxID=2547811 RepID=UPI002E1CA0FD|nr:Ger(x)C family spore germination protein [Bacillus salipaludis]